MAKPTILIAEDHPELRRLLTTILSKHDFDVVTAEDGEKAVELAATVRPDVILMDLEMPRMDGIEATRRLKEVGATASIPVVFYTAHPDPKNIEAAIKAGASDFLVKTDTQFEELLRKIRKYATQPRGKSGAPARPLSVVIRDASKILQSAARPQPPPACPEPRRGAAPRSPAHAKPAPASAETPEKAEPSTELTVQVTAEEAATLTGLGFSKEEHGHAGRALREYGQALRAIAPLAAGRLHGSAIYHAAYAAEKHSLESVERVLRELAGEYRLEGTDVLHAAASEKKHGLEATRVAIKLGWRRTDIGYAAEAARLWPNLQAGEQNLDQLRKIFKKIRADVMDDDIRHCATVLLHMNSDLLERALRDRHTKNEREPWFRGISIQLVAWAYKLSEPHAGSAIDECRQRGGRREKMGHEVLARISRKFGRPVGPPPWLGGGKE